LFLVNLVVGGDLGHAKAPAIQPGYFDPAANEKVWFI